MTCKKKRCPPPPLLNICSSSKRLRKFRAPHTCSFRQWSCPMQLFDRVRFGDVELRNRIVVSPMCEYSAIDGVPNDWHFVHLGSRAVGGAGLVFTEATAVSPEGRVSPADAGLYNDEQQHAWTRIVKFIADHGAAPGIQ